MIVARAADPSVEARPAAAPLASRKALLADWDVLLGGISRGKTVLKCGEDHAIFIQGQAADAVFFLLRGKVQLTVASEDGKEAIVATIGPGEFFGEGCLAGQPNRMGTATSAVTCALLRVERATLARVLGEAPDLAAIFMSHLLSRIVRYEADLVDQIFNSSEKRLARILLLLSHFGRESQTETVVAGISQEHLAQMVGTTRSRINLFMNKFRKLGFIDYNAEDGLTVHRGLLSVVRSQD
jgi:CRP-like cAMP-binding protein